MEKYGNLIQWRRSLKGKKSPPIFKKHLPFGIIDLMGLWCVNERPRYTISSRSPFKLDLKRRNTYIPPVKDIKEILQTEKRFAVTDTEKNTINKTKYLSSLYRSMPKTIEVGFFGNDYINSTGFTHLDSPKIEIKRKMLPSETTRTIAHELKHLQQIAKYGKEHIANYYKTQGYFNNKYEADAAREESKKLKHLTKKIKEALNGTKRQTYKTLSKRYTKDNKTQRNINPVDGSKRQGMIPRTLRKSSKYKIL